MLPRFLIFFAVCFIFVSCAEQNNKAQSETVAAEIDRYRLAFFKFFQAVG